MPTSILTAGDASNGLVQASGNDGALTIQTGAAGAKVDAIRITSAGIPTFSQLAATFGASGSVTLPSGLIVKWGTFAVSNAGYTACTFTSAFPTAALTVVATPLNSAANALTVGISALSTTAFNAGIILNTTFQNGSIYWIALGH